MNLNHLFRQLNIQWKLIIAFVGLSTIPVSLIGFYEIHTRLHTLEHIAIQNVQHDVFNVQEKAQAFFSHVEGDMHYLSHLLAFQQLVAVLGRDDSHGTQEQRYQVSELFRSFAHSKPAYYRFKLIDEYGDEIFRIEKRGGKAQIVPEEELEVDRGGYYLVAMARFQPGQVFLSPAELLDPTTGDYVPVISYAIPLFSADGERHGILIADVFAESFFKILEGSRASPPGRIFVVSQEGYYLYHPDKKRDWSRLLASRSTDNVFRRYRLPIASRILSGATGTITEESEAIISYAPLFYGSTTYHNYYVVYRDVPKKDLFASVRRFKQVYGGLLVSVLLIALSLGLLAARQFTHPILQLKEGAAIIGRGDFGHRLDIHTNDEIEELAVQFNQMAEAIRQRERENARLRAQLQRHAERLEEMVEERTRELREAQDQLIQAEKLGAIGRLAAGVAHEINNPMAVISTCVEGLQARLQASQAVTDLEDLPEYLNAIREAAYRCKGITQKLLNFSRNAPLVLVSTDVNQTIRDTVALVEYEATQAGQEIRLDLDPALPRITADPDQLGQVFLNLILNAFDAMPSGGRLEICTYWKAQASHIEIRFQDTGWGIPPDQLNKIFEPFYTTKGTGRGTGLGLAICQRIIQSHQGKILVESTVGKGTTFRIQLPKSPKPIDS